MPKSLAEVMKRLPKARRAKIEAATAQEAMQIMSLREIRKAFSKSQETLAKELDIEQETVSRIERRADLLLSTLRKYVEAMGGELKLVAEFPGQTPIQIDASDMLREPKRTAGKSKRG